MYFGNLLYKYTAARQISFYRDKGNFAPAFMDFAFFLITPPERSAPPFWACVSGAKGSSQINHPLRKKRIPGFIMAISPSHSITLGVRLY